MEWRVERVVRAVVTPWIGITNEIRFEREKKVQCGYLVPVSSGVIGILELKKWFCKTTRKWRKGNLRGKKVN